jgi:signal transduction histidine kinase
MLAYTVVLAAVLLSAWWSERSFSAVENAAERLSRRSVEGMQLMGELNRLLRERSDFEQKLLLGDGSARTAFEPQPSSFQSWLAEMEEFAHSPEERELLEHMRTAYQSFATEAAALGPLQQAGKTDEARLAFTRLAAAVEHLLTDSETLFQSTEHDMRDRKHRAEATVDGARQLVLWTTAIGGLCSLILGFILTRHAARPIVRLVLRLGASGAVDRVEFDGDEIGTLERHVGSLLDRVRRQERALQQAEKLSELGEIASEIAHETLNPVAGVKAMLQALRRTSLPADKLAAELANVERQLTRVEEIVRRLVRYARPLEPNMRRISVMQVIERAVAAARLAPGACDRRIEIVGAQPNCEWVMDPDLVEQVLVNLLVNGCEASPPGSSVELATKVENRQICFSVRDHGGGLGTVDRDRLFHPFYTTKPRGNGLGLAISRNIAREHGGQIEAVSFDGVGSEFRVVLPEREAACAEPS